MINSIEDNLSRYFPFLSRTAVDIRDAKFMCLLIDTEDGDRYLYNDLDKTYRRIPGLIEVDKEEYNKEFGYRLAEIMEFRAMDQYELSEKVKISQPMISLYINGKSMPPFIVISRMAKALKCSIDDLDPMTYIL